MRESLDGGIRTWVHALTERIDVPDVEQKRHAIEDHDCYEKGQR